MIRCSCLALPSKRGSSSILPMPVPAKSDWPDRPVRAGVGGAQDAQALIRVAREVILAGAGEDDVRVLAVDDDGVDRQRRLEVAQRLPVLAAVGGLPDATLRRADVNGPGVFGIEGDREQAARDRLGEVVAVVQRCGTELLPGEERASARHAVGRFWPASTAAGAM